MEQSNVQNNEVDANKVSAYVIFNITIPDILCDQLEIIFNTFWHQDLPYNIRVSTPAEIQAFIECHNDDFFSTLSYWDKDDYMTISVMIGMNERSTFDQWLHNFPYDLFINSY